MPLSGLEQRVCRIIAGMDSRMRSDLAAYVAIPTGQNFEPGLNEYRALLVERLRRLGAVIEFVPGEPKPPWLTLPGHDDDSGAIPPVVIARRNRTARLRPRVLIVGH